MKKALLTLLICLAHIACLLFAEALLAVTIIWEPGQKYTGEMTAYRHYYKNPGTTYFAILSENKIEEVVGVINNLIADHAHLDPIVIL